MLLEIKCQCKVCKSLVSVRCLDNSLLDKCPECGSDPLTIQGYPGLIYVVNNKNQAGIKIGMTEKPIEDRLRNLSSTGVPGRFVAIATFPTKNPKKDEKKIHEKLKRFWIAKEHFEIEPTEAVLKIYRLFQKRRKPIFYCEKVRADFCNSIITSSETMRLKLQGNGLAR